MLIARKKSILFQDWTFFKEGEVCAEIQSRWLRGPLIIVEGMTYEYSSRHEAIDTLGWNTVHKVRLMQNGRAIIDSEIKSESLGLNSSFSYANNTYEVRIHRLNLTHEIFQNSTLLGKVRVKLKLNSTCEIDLPESIPLFLQVFLFFRVLAKL